MVSANFHEHEEMQKLQAEALVKELEERFQGGNFHPEDMERDLKKLEELMRHPHLRERILQLRQNFNDKFKHKLDSAPIAPVKKIMAVADSGSEMFNHWVAQIVHAQNSIRALVETGGMTLFNNSGAVIPADQLFTTTAATRGKKAEAPAVIQIEERRFGEALVAFNQLVDGLKGLGVEAEIEEVSVANNNPSAKKAPGRAAEFREEAMLQWAPEASQSDEEMIVTSPAPRITTGQNLSSNSFMVSMLLPERLENFSNIFFMDEPQLRSLTTLSVKKENSEEKMVWHRTIIGSDMDSVASLFSQIEESRYTFPSNVCKPSSAISLTPLNSREIY